MSHVTGFAALIGVLLLGGTARVAVAQSDPADCAARAAAVLRSGLDDDTAWRLVHCPMRAPDVLARLWLRRDARTTAQRRILTDVSSSWRDARVLGAVSSIVASTSDPYEDRMAALSVLLRYFEPSFAPVEAWLPADTLVSVQARVTDSPPQREGARPLPPDIRARIAGDLARITISDADTIFPKVVRRMRQVFAYHDPATTPVPTGTLTLVAGCGRRVTVRSTADIALPIDVRVLGTSFVYHGGIARGTPTKPTAVLLGLPPGEVVATLGSREIARLTERNAPCLPGQPR